MPDPLAGPMRVSVLWLPCGIALSPFSSRKDPKQAIESCEDWESETTDDTHGKELRIGFESLLMTSLQTIEESGILCVAISIQVR